MGYLCQVRAFVTTTGCMLVGTFISGESQALLRVLMGVSVSDNNFCHYQSGYVGFVTLVLQELRFFIFIFGHSTILFLCYDIGILRY